MSEPESNIERGHRNIGVIRLAAYLLGVVVLAIVLLAFWPIGGMPRTAYQRNAVIMAVRSDYRDKGLWPPTTEEYFSSVFGNAASILRQRSPSRGNLGGLKLSHSINGSSIAVSVSFNRFSYDGKQNRFSIVEKLSCSKQDQTLRLLSASLRGTKWWSRDLTWWRGYYQKAFPGSPKIIVPGIGFDVPSTDEQLREYWYWLARITGSVDRFRDGWHRRILLELDTSGNTPVLSARSAGEDGTWQTNDDIVVERNVGSTQHELH